MTTWGDIASLEVSPQEVRCHGEVDLECMAMRVGLLEAWEWPRRNRASEISGFLTGKQTN